MAFPLAYRAAAVCLAALLALPSASSAQVAVVVNPANTIDDLSMDRLRRLFLGQATTFPAGGRARLATHVGSAATFDHTALALGPEIVRSRWMAMVFRGEATAIPADFASADGVKQFVREHPDAIAFIPAAAVDATVKVVRIDGRRPSDAGYPIR